MAEAILGGLLGYGLALAAFFIFRWADGAYLAAHEPPAAAVDAAPRRAA